MTDVVFLRGRHRAPTLPAASSWTLRSQDQRLEVPGRYPINIPGSVCLFYYLRLRTPAFPNTLLATASEQEITSGGSQVT